MNKYHLFIVILLIGVLGGAIVYDKYINVVPPIPPTPTPTPPEPTPIPPEPQPIPPPIPPPEPTIEDALRDITENDIKINLRELSSEKYAGRRTGTDGNNLAAKYISEWFIKHNISTKLQSFTYSGASTQNVLGIINGQTSEIIVIGAHYDAVGRGCLGADDNASGTVVAMSLAKAYVILQKTLKRTVIFQLYSAEESGLHGSRYYVENPIFPIRNHVFMLNLDMVGRLSESQFSWRNTSVISTSIDIDPIIDDLSRKYIFAKRISGKGGNGSDHVSFANRGIPIAWLFTGLHADYHKPTDTYDKVNTKGLEQIAKYALELSYLITMKQYNLRFNVEEFKSLEYSSNKDDL